MATQSFSIGRGLVLYFLNKQGHRMYYTVNKQWVNEIVLRAGAIKLFKSLDLAKRAAKRHARFQPPIHIIRVLEQIELRDHL